MHPQDLQSAAEDLHYAAKRGELSRVRYLLQKHERRLAALLVAPEPDSGKTALHLAAEGGCVGTVGALLEAAHTAGPLPLPVAAAPAHEPQGNWVSHGLRRLHRGESGRSTADSETNGHGWLGALSPRAGHVPAIRENGGSAADSHADCDVLAFASSTASGAGSVGEADGQGRGAGAEQDTSGATLCSAALACMYGVR